MNLFKVYLTFWFFMIFPLYYYYSQFLLTGWVYVYEVCGGLKVSCGLYLLDQDCLTKL